MALRLRRRQIPWMPGHRFAVGNNERSKFAARRKAKIARMGPRKISKVEPGLANAASSALVEREMEQVHQPHDALTFQHERIQHELRHLEAQQQQQRAPVAAADSEKRAAGTAAAQAPSADSASARSHPFPLGRRVRGANRMDRNEPGTIVAWRYQNTRCAALLRR